MIVNHLQHALILVVALCYGEARSLECSQKVGGTGDNTCPRMVEDDNVWRCLSSILNCSNGLVYHCLRNERGEWTEVCAKEEMCEKGKEPMLTNAGNIVCRYCHDPERYNPEKETLSNKLSECPNKKTVCIKEKTDRIECEEPYDKDDPNAKFKMDRQCRCSYEEDMIPKFYFFGRDTWTCSYPEVMKCLHVPCPMSEDGKKQTRGRGYKCFPVETISPVTSISAIAFNKSKTTFRVTVEDINKKTSRVLDSTTEVHTSLAPSETITDNSDVPQDGSLTYKLVVGCVGVIVVITIVSVYCHWCFKKHRNENTPVPTVVRNTTNYAEYMIRTERGRPIVNLVTNNSLNTESPEITPHRPNRPKHDYKRATSDETFNLNDVPLASGEEMDDMDDTDIQLQEDELHSSVEVDIHEPLSETFNDHFENMYIDKGKDRADVESKNNHRHSLSQGTGIFNKQTVGREDPESKSRSNSNVAVSVAELEAGGSGELSEGSDEDEMLETSAPFNYRTEEQNNRSLNSEPEDNNENHLSTSRQYNAHDTVNFKDAEAKQILDTLVEDPWEVLAEKTEQIENNFLKKSLKIPDKTATCIKHLQPYQKSQPSLPEDLEVFESSPNGDCLYNSVSIILYGDERAAYRLRLGAVLEGVKNHKKYIKQLITDRNNVQEMRLFMQSVLTDQSLNMLDASRYEDLEYLAQFLIQNAVLETIKPGSYSSPIQVLFLANAIGYRIRQYYEHEMLPKDDVLPLFDAENTEDCIILLWVKTDGSGMLNHIVPVLPKEKSSPSNVV